MSRQEDSVDDRFVGRAACNARTQEPSSNEKLSLTVPRGAGPGAKLRCAAPDGQELRLTVPAGVPPGSLMTLTQDPVTRRWTCVAEPGSFVQDHGFTVPELSTSF